MLLFELLLNRLPIRKLLRISHLEPRGFEPLIRPERALSFKGSGRTSEANRPEEK